MEKLFNTSRVAIGASMIAGALYLSSYKDEPNNPEPTQIENIDHKDTPQLQELKLDIATNPVSTEIVERCKKLLGSIDRNSEHDAIIIDKDELGREITGKDYAFSDADFIEHVEAVQGGVAACECRTVKWVDGKTLNACSFDERMDEEEMKMSHFSISRDPNGSTSIWSKIEKMVPDGKGDSRFVELFHDERCFNDKNGKKDCEEVSKTDQKNFDNVFNAIKTAAFEMKKTKK